MKSAAATIIGSPIEGSDIEVEVLYSTGADQGVRADIDNVLKPTLDALKDVAYRDDAQVRSVTATLFDHRKDNVVAGRVEHLGPLFFSPYDHVLLISIYSDSRLAELGGEEAINHHRRLAFLAE